MNTAYSFQTSLPAYHDLKEVKRTQAEQLLIAIGNSPLGTCLKQLQNQMGLPQSTISGRTNDLIAGRKAMYSGIINYEGRNRKRIVLFMEGNQLNLL